MALPRAGFKTSLRRSSKMLNPVTSVNFSMIFFQRSARIPLPVSIPAAALALTSSIAASTFSRKALTTGVAAAIFSSTMAFNLLRKSMTLA